jgi:type IV pilus assembly protein PilX
MAIALIMLLMLTIIGVTSMSSGNLQEVMARNMLDRNYAFQAGESGLRDAEFDVENNMTAGAGFDASCTNGLCLPPASTTDPPVWESVVDWDDASLTRDFGEYTADDENYKNTLKKSLAAAPRYIIEYNDIACDPTVPGEELTSFGSAPVKFDKYRITSQATGRSSQARIRLQSTYRKRNGRC